MKANRVSFDKLLSDTEDDVAYLAMVDKLEHNIKRFLKAFQIHYSHSNIGYSYKTNYLPVFCRLANSLGLYAEVVSGMEYNFAQRCGVENERIIFNGPNKKKAELTIALLNRAMVNIDSLNELFLVKSIIQQYPERQFSVGLRCNLGRVGGKIISRFGLSWENGQIEVAAKNIDAMPNCSLRGLHCHFSYDRTLESYNDRTQLMIEIADSLFKKDSPGYINIGGGFSGHLPEKLRSQIGDMPSYEEYGEVITSKMVKHYGANGPELILEPGVGLVADTMRYVCRVLAMKNLPGRNVAVTSGSIHHLKIVPSSINLPFSIFSKGNLQPQRVEHVPVDVVGFTCLEHDVMYTDHYGSISIGDILVFDNVGAYSFVASPNFIRTTPPIYLFKNQRWVQVKHQLSTDDILQQFDVQEGMK